MNQARHPDPAWSAASEDPDRTAEIPAQQTRPVWFGEPDAPAGHRSSAGQPSAPGHPTPTGHPSPTGYPAPEGAAAAYGAATPQSPAGPPPPAPPRVGAEDAQPAKPRRWAELTTVATLAAVLASGGTYAVTQLGAPETQTTPAANSAPSLGRGADTAPVQQADPNNPNWTATSAAVSPSVVAITVRAQGGSGQGSGVVIDDRGHVLTNNHVVSGGGSQAEIRVTLSDGRTYAAEVAGTDPSTDLAVLTLQDPPKDLKAISLGDSDALKVGDPVMAVGNPLGLAGTVTTGIVSALNRPVTTSGEGSDGTAQAEPVVTNAIQTSAAINPGNSGGALVNVSGQLVGINSSIATLGANGGQSGSIGIGFAIPVNEAEWVAQQLIDKGTAEHAFLGVTPEDGTARDDSATRAGATIRDISAGTPAAEAGLRVGDTVIAVDGEPVDSSLSLVAHIRERSVGDEVKLTVLRDGKRVELTASLVARPSGSR